MNGVKGSLSRRINRRLVEGNIVKDLSKLVMSSPGFRVGWLGSGMVDLVMKDCVLDRLCNRMRFTR